MEMLFLNITHLFKIFGNKNHYRKLKVENKLNDNKEKNNIIVCRTQYLLRLNYKYI